MRGATIVEASGADRACQPTESEPVSGSYFKMTGNWSQNDLNLRSGGSLEAGPERSGLGGRGRKAVSGKVQRRWRPAALGLIGSFMAAAEPEQRRSVNERAAPSLATSLGVHQGQPTHRFASRASADTGILDRPGWPRPVIRL